MNFAQANLLGTAFKFRGGFFARYLVSRTDWFNYCLIAFNATSLFERVKHLLYRERIEKVGLPIGRCTSKLLLRSRDRSRARSPIRGGRLVISLQPASSSANAAILPISSGKDANLLCATSNVWRGSLHISRGSDVNWFRLRIILYSLNKFTRATFVADWNFSQTDNRLLNSNKLFYNNYYERIICRIYPNWILIFLNRYGV